MSIGKQLLAQGFKVLTSDDFFKDVLQAVADIDGETGLTGQQKHDKVLADLKEIAKDIAIPLINLGIEIAVLFISSKAVVAAPLVQDIGTSATTVIDNKIKDL